MAVGHGVSAHDRGSRSAQKGKRTSGRPVKRAMTGSSEGCLDSDAKHDEDSGMKAGKILEATLVASGIMPRRRRQWNRRKKQWEVVGPRLTELKEEIAWLEASADNCFGPNASQRTIAW